MNGAELACGTALKVEPSDPLYALRKKKQEASRYGPPETIQEDHEGNFTQKVEDPKTAESRLFESKPVWKENGGEEDDLDDFFASL
jgi:hypothetical protein